MGWQLPFPKASEKKLDKKILLLSLVLLAVLAFGSLGRDRDWEVYGVCLVLQGVLFAWYDKWSKKNFGGITGDLAGFFLQAEELICLTVVAFFIENNVKISELVKIS